MRSKSLGPKKIRKLMREKISETRLAVLPMIKSQPSRTASIMPSHFIFMGIKNMKSTSVSGKRAAQASSSERLR